MKSEHMSINLYKPIYNLLEDEVLNLSNYILFTDKHYKVTSIKIAELLLRIVSEIENIAKAICAKNKIKFYEKDKKTKKKRIKQNIKLYEYLDRIEELYRINKKYVTIINHNFHFFDKTLIPFEKVKTKGREEREWHYAYNKLKHDRDKNFKQANLCNLIQALAGLFLLNIYYADENFYTDKDDLSYIKEQVNRHNKVFHIEYYLVFDNHEINNKIQNDPRNPEFVKHLADIETMKEIWSVYAIRRNYLIKNQFVSMLYYSEYIQKGGKPEEYDDSSIGISTKYHASVIRYK